MWETIKKAERWRIGAFELWCWRRFLRAPWISRRSNQSILKEINLNHWKDWCWSWNSNTLTTWFEELTLLKRLWSWERLKAGGEGDDRGWDDWMTSLIQWTWVWVNSGLGDGQGGLACCSPQGRRELDMTDWTDWLKMISYEVDLLVLVTAICSRQDTFGYSWLRDDNTVV